MMRKKFLFVVPARGGSQRLPGKNIRIFNGKPLIFWTLEQAKRLNNYGNVVVTSDCNLILKKCSIYKDIILFKRPKYLSTDKASLIDVVKHLIKKLQFKESILLLQPTSPLRRDVDIIKGIKMIDKGAEAVMSQSQLQYNTKKINLNDKNKNFKPLNKKSIPLYAPNGAFFGATYKWLLKNSSFYVKSVKTYEMPLERSIDIDYEYQFKMAEFFLQKHGIK
tara:strand:+ start:223 stop:885 length:663 start_codon:yes stop_codon:yes gene_type:complete